MHRISIPSLVVLAVVVFVGTACGSSTSSSSSPQDAVCQDASAFEASVNSLVDDVKNGNFSDAKDQLSKVGSNSRALQSSVKDLATAKKSSVQTDLDEVKTTLSDLTSASSLSEIQSTLGTTESQLKDAVSSMEGSLSC